MRYLKSNQTRPFGTPKQGAMQSAGRQACSQPHPSCRPARPRILQRSGSGRSSIFTSDAMSPEAGRAAGTRYTAESSEAPLCCTDGWEMLPASDMGSSNGLLGMSGAAAPAQAQEAYHMPHAARGAAMAPLHSGPHAQHQALITARHTNMEARAPPASPPTAPAHLGPWAAAHTTTCPMPRLRCSPRLHLAHARPFGRCYQLPSCCRQSLQMDRLLLPPSRQACPVSAAQPPVPAPLTAVAVTL